MAKRDNISMLVVRRLPRYYRFLTELHAEGVMRISSKELADYINKLTGIEAKIVVPGYIQRGGSPSPYDRVMATRFGVAAARLIRDRQYGYMVAIQDGVIVPVPLEEAASQTKFLDVDTNLVLRTARDIGIFFGD